MTPLFKIKSLSEMTGCEIFGKAEHLNPGGSVKYRTALGIIDDAENRGHIQPGDTLVEGTAGNTGIGIATIAAERNYRCLIVMPDNQAEEKYAILRKLGAEVVTTPPSPFSDQNHFYHLARRLADEKANAYWVNQFENLANFRAHYSTTGREIWEQLNGMVDCFVTSAGTGGTIAGVSRFLKEKNPQVHVRLVDPLGSGLHSYIEQGVFAATGTSMTEGIGIMRLTANFREARVDDAVQVDDQKMISMLYHLAHHDKLLVGTSTALNLYGAYEYALENKNSGMKIVTILCDSALRYKSKVFNEQFLADRKLLPIADLSSACASGLQWKAFSWLVKLRRS